MSNQGATTPHGLGPMTNSNPDGVRFARLFDLDPLQIDAASLEKLGGPGGPMDGGATSNLTDAVPVGFIFLGQFIDHDITLDVTSQLNGQNNPDETENFRTPALDLDCVYGDGPEASFHLYDRDGEKLMTGLDGSAVLQQSLMHRNRDLVRNPDGIAIIGDPRNDENRIISQLQLAFLRFHNAILERVKTGDLDAHRETPDEDDFHFAQRMARWHYQWMIVHEFLPHMIGQPLVDEILVERKFYKPTGRPFIPIEFAAAAYRFGHSMIPQTLRTQTDQPNPLSLFGRTLGSGFRPLADNDGVVDWSLMFQINGNVAQNANQLDVNLASILLDLPFISEGETSLATRNLLRGQSFNLPSGQAIAAEIGVSNDDIERVNSLVNALTTSHPDIDLSAGTPLWFYILAEAQTIGRRDADGLKPGEGLGQVGGTIVGEVLIGLIEKDESSYLNGPAGWMPVLTTDGTFGMKDLLTLPDAVA